MRLKECNYQEEVESLETSDDILLSIIIAVKNPCRYLKESLYSLKNQELKQVELILVVTSELSSDEVRSLSLLRARYRIVIRNPDGAVSAMNHGLSLSSAKFVYFLGSGDKLCSQVLKTVVEQLSSTQAQVLIYKVIMPSGHIYPPFDVSSAHIVRGVMPCHQGVIMSRDLMNALVGFDLRYPIAADFDQLVRATIENARIKNFDLCIASYLGGGQSNDGSLREQFLILYRNRFFINAIRFLFIEFCAKLYRKYIRFIP